MRLHLKQLYITFRQKLLVRDRIERLFESLAQTTTKFDGYFGGYDPGPDYDAMWNKFAD
jgi:hypothetical protein